jgi:hypothetical protein
MITDIDRAAHGSFGQLDRGAFCRLQRRGHSRTVAPASQACPRGGWSRTRVRVSHLWLPRAGGPSLPRESGRLGTPPSRLRRSARSARRFVRGCCPFAARRPGHKQTEPSGRVLGPGLSCAVCVVGATGFEPVTSSVSANHREPLCGRPLSQVASDRRGRSKALTSHSVKRSLRVRISVPAGCAIRTPALFHLTQHRYLPAHMHLTMLAHHLEQQPPLLLTQTRLTRLSLITFRSTIKFQPRTAMRVRRSPVAVEPVREIFRTRGSPTSASPACLPGR